MTPTRLATAAGPAALLVTAACAGILPAAYAALLAQAFIFGFAALGVGFLDRHAGFVSFGHATWFALPGYLLGIACNLRLVSAELALPLALLASIALAALVGLVVVRVPGVAFSMLTLAVGQSAYEVASKARGLTGGADGLVPDLPATLYGVEVAMLQSPRIMLVLAAVLLAATLVALVAFSRSRLGRVTLAVRENEERARFIGLRTLAPRVLVFAASAAIAGVGGLLFTIYASFLSVESLHWSASGAALVMALLGGLRSLAGPVAGAVLYFLLRDLLGSVSEHWLGILGLCIIVVAVGFPGGIAGGLAAAARRLGAAG